MNKNNLETPSCALCGSRDAVPRYSWNDKPYGVVRCKACRFHYLSPRPTEAAMIQLYSQDSYFEGDEERGYTSYRAQEQALRLTFRKLLKNLARRGIRGGRLLEVGCGLGYLLNEARPYFELRHGTDYSAAAVASAKASGELVVQGGLDALSADLRYECIISNHVIEHVYHPQAFVEAIMAHLAPGGHLLLSTPDMGSLWRRCLGRSWPSFKLPEHILYFDRDHLTTLLRCGGAVDIEVVPYPHAFPAALIASKLGLNLGGSLGNLALWVPGTTLALRARKPA